MTFEEFFGKKKIDLVQLQRAKPNLYEEFRQHYTQMGEKSFDHTKKYWFNRLRKEFLLNETETQTEKHVVTKPVAASGLSAAEAAKPTGFKPRFKAATARATPDPAKLPEKPQKEVPQKAPPPTGFKPRFKAGATGAAKQHPEAATNAETDHSPSTSGTSAAPTPDPAKPLGFKPRFKTGNTNKGDNQKE